MLLVAVLAPVLLAVYNSVQDPDYLQTGSGPDPLKAYSPVYAAGSNAALDIVVYGAPVRNFVELYCYEPLEMAGMKFFIVGINISSRRNETYPLSLRQFLVVDTKGGRNQAHADRQVFEEDLEQPFIIDAKGEGFLLPWENRTADMVFILNATVTPAQIALEDPAGDIKLDLR